MFDRLIPFLSSFVLLAGWELLLSFPRYFVFTVTATIVVFFALLLKLNKWRIKDKDFWLLATPGLSLVSLTTAFLLFLSNYWGRQAVIVLISVASYYFVSYFYYFLCRITSYTPLSLEQTSSYFNIISYLGLGISAYGFINLLNLKLWHLALIVIAATAVLTYQFFWINKIEERQNLFASILISVLMAEYFWAISFFPVSHFISGLSLAIIYYAVINLSLANFLDKLEKKVARWYLTVGVVCLFVILLSARWL